jgi:hypothetical protein
VSTKGLTNTVNLFIRILRYLEHLLTALILQRNNKFDYRGRDCEDDGTRWWEAQWAKDKDKARKEKEERETKGEEAIERSQIYNPTTPEELEAATWYRLACEHEKEKRAEMKAAAERYAAEKQREDAKKAEEAERAEREAKDAVAIKAKKGWNTWWKQLLPK